jgi:AcrR family transcriptional regulator
MLSREEKKLQTRKSLMEAALTLVGQGENFSSISLREVAKGAGVVPTSFYRHFTGMEELGLNLVDDLGMMLRKLMRATRQNNGFDEKMTRNSVEVYVEYVSQHRNYFYFMCQCRGGGTPKLREGIRNELKYFVNELASDLRQLPTTRSMAANDLEVACQLLVETVFDSTAELLDLIDSRAAYRDEFSARLVKKLRFIWLGLKQWHSQPCQV